MVSLRQAGLRATTARTAIFDWLLRQQRPTSVEAVWEKMKSVGIDRVTVYRTLEALESTGLVRQVDLGHSHAHYEVNDPERHHHHLVCESCGAVRDVRFAQEARLIQRLERDHHFQARSHAFEIFGLCKNCK